MTEYSKNCCANCGNGERTVDQGWPVQKVDFIACSIHMLGETQDWYDPRHVCDDWKPKLLIGGKNETGDKSS
jgi:hypothetical protein